MEPSGNPAGFFRSWKKVRGAGRSVSRSEHQPQEGPLRKSLVLISTLILLVCSTSAFAQIRGMGRQAGVVTDAATAKPVVGATVTLTPAKTSTIPIIVKTDKGGRWNAVGMTTGGWNIEITADGYVSKKTGADIDEYHIGQLIQTKLDPAPKPVEAPPPVEVVKPTPLVPKEAIDAIKEAQDLLRATDNVQDNAKKAVADLEKALPMIPTNKPEIAPVRVQVQEVLAQAYYKAGDLKNAIATLEKLNVADPFSTPDANQTPRQILLANLYLENGQLDEAKALLAKLPANAITDANVYTNMGIIALNKKKPADAEGYFTKAIALDPKMADAYFYRGLSFMHQNKKKAAKADFEQVVVLAPADAQTSKDAKQYIAGLK
jgi:Tfp pilus assembly protein PilF